MLASYAPRCPKYTFNSDQKSRDQNSCSQKIVFAYSRQNYRITSTDKLYGKTVYIKKTSSLLLVYTYWNLNVLRFIFCERKTYFEIGNQRKKCRYFCGWVLRKIKIKEIVHDFSYYNCCDNFAQCRLRDATLRFDMCLYLYNNSFFFTNVLCQYDTQNWHGGKHEKIYSFFLCGWFLLNPVRALALKIILEHIYLNGSNKSIKMPKKIYKLRYEHEH